MPLLEAESVPILTEKRVSRARKDASAPGDTHLKALALRAREEILAPFLTSPDGAKLRSEFENAIERFRAVRLEANWRRIKRNGIAWVLRSSRQDLDDLQESLGKSKMRATWVSAASRWLKQLQSEYDSLEALVPKLEDLKLDLSQIPLEWVERWLPSKVPCADVESFALSSVAAVLDGEITRSNPRRLAYVIRAAAKVESDYALLLRGWAAFMNEVVRPSGTPKEFRLKLSPDVLTLWVAIAVTGRQGDLSWLERLAKLSQEVFPSASKLTLVGSRDPELPEVVKLCLHAESESGLDALVDSEPRFWAEVGNRVGPELLDLLVLSFRPAANGSPAIP